MNTLAKTVLVIVLLLFYIIIAAVLALLPVGPAARRKLLARNVSFFSRIVLRSLGIRVISRKRGHHPVTDRAYLIISNHVSYLDVLTIASLRPSLFITSVELRKTFPLGMIALLGGSIFVERRSPTGLKREIRDIGRALRHGSSVVLFPEGTTFDGGTVHPFKNSLFAAAIETGTPVLPLCIRYRRINGRRLNRQNRDWVHYYGGATFAAHAPRLLKLRTLHVEHTVLDPIPAGPGRSRKDLAVQCHAVISEEYHRAHGS